MDIDPATLQFGIDTFGDITIDSSGQRLSHAEVLRNVVEEAALADRVGIDVIGIGEHHREDFAVSAPEVVLAAIAARTTRIRLASAVTVLSSDDPVRVFERFATLDALSNGRAEVIVGRGSFTESFPLFGFDLADYEKLFEEKLELFAALRRQEPVTWSGDTRAALTDQLVYPPIAGDRRLTTWVGVGGSPESVVRAAHYGLPLVLAIIGGDPARFAPFVDLYRRALTQFDQPDLPIAVHSHGYVADSDEQAADELWPAWQSTTNRIGRERGWPPATRARFDEEVAHGALHVGSPETVARKIARTVSALGVQRFDMKYSNGTLAHEKAMRSIELYGTQVIPRVRELIAAQLAPNTLDATREW